MKSRPIAVDVFAGAGGLSLGFEQAGFDVVAAVELDPIHAAIHKLNFPDCAILCADASRVSARDIRTEAGIGGRDIDVVIGGPPCQGFSVIGRRAMEDPRSGLVFHFMRLVHDLCPRAFVLENVPGMATGQHGAFLEALIAGFSEMKHHVRLPYRILNAANFGVPQDRRRLFLLGAREGEVLPDYPAPRTGAQGRTALDGSGLPKAPSVWDAIGDLPELECYEALLDSDVLRARMKGDSVYSLRLRGDISDPEDFSHLRKCDPDILTGCLRARHSDLSRARFSATPGGATEPVSRLFKLTQDGLCNTLRSGTGRDRGAFSAPRPIHPVYPRCISVREAARLHSYPDWFRFHRTIWHGFREIGNSVPPLLARAVGAAVRDALGCEPIRPDPDSVLELGPDDLASYDMKAAAAHFGVQHNVIPPRRRTRPKEVG